MKDYLKLIDTNTKGNRHDITTLYANYEGFIKLIEDLAEEFHDDGIDYVAAIDALGFVLGTALAQKLGIGIITIRKGGKLPVDTYKDDFTDYTGLQKSLEIRKDILPQGSKVLITDEWVETGAQVFAATKLIEKCGAIVAGIATICMDENTLTDSLRNSYKVVTVWQE